MTSWNADWLSRDAVSFSLESPNTAIDYLLESLKPDVEILGLGEALHGGEEILQLRNTMFQRLVEKYGFTAIALESSFTRGLVVNDYIAGAGPSSYEKIADSGFSHGFGKIDRNRDLIEWMRACNADLPYANRLQFYGFDMPGALGPIGPREPLDRTLAFVAKYDEAAALDYRARIEPLLGEDAIWENPMNWRDPAQAPALVEAANSLRVAAADLISLLRANESEWGTAPGETHGLFQESLQCAIIADGMLAFFVAMAGDSAFSASLAVRDALMADNLKYIAARVCSQTKGRLLVFAHNMHLQRGEAEWSFGNQCNRWSPAGETLHKWFGERYAVIGTAVGTSDDNQIGSPEPNTLEAYLTAASGLISFVSTKPNKDISTLPPLNLPGRTGSTRNPTYFPLTAQSLTDFDFLATFQSVTYPPGARPLLG